MEIASTDVDTRNDEDVYVRCAFKMYLGNACRDVLKEMQTRTAV